MNIELNLLLYFVAVADELSFRKAADRLNIAQPWLSRQIRKLEGQLGFDLFVRTTRHVSLTDKGVRLLERARIMAREVAATNALASSLKYERPDSLCLGVPLYSLYVSERISLFQAFAERYPGVKLDMRTGLSSELQACLLRGEIDAAFSAGAIDETGLDVLTLCSGRVEIMMRNADPLAQKPVLSPDDLAGRDVSVFSRAANPGLYDQLFGALEGRAAKLVENTDVGFTRRLHEQATVTAVPSWAPLLDPASVRRRLVPSREVIKLQILRRRGGQSSSLEALWQLAVASVAQQALASAEAGRA